MNLIIYRGGRNEQKKRGKESEMLQGTATLSQKEQSRAGLKIFAWKYQQRGEELKKLVFSFM